LYAQSEVNASEEVLHKIFSEIMINLRRNTPADGRVQITSEDEDEDEYVHLTIENSSEGIPADAMERVFDPLYRYQDPLTHSSGFEYGGGGIGMGLSIVRQLVTALNGEIWFENRRSTTAGQENRVALHLRLKRL
ncbi:MAG: ATP-binding protein, partial [Gammaproteobacteria bacterium]|nr:ATP-binding protein [Gammaproteobacteria bacterium]